MNCCQECGTLLPFTDGAIHRGRRRFFCSRECVRRFDLRWAIEPDPKEKP